MGQLTRIEADRRIIGYSFNPIANDIIPEYQQNPSSGQTHSFVAYRQRDINTPSVTMKNS